MDPPDLQWIDARDLCIEGLGFADTAHPYDRLPARAEGVVRDVIWSLAQRTPDVLVQFETNATAIHTRVVLRPPLPEACLYRKYLDLYIRDDGAWRWGGVSQFGFLPSGQTPLVTGLAQATRACRLYLPPFFAVDRLWIGVPKDATIRALPARTERPVAVYGTSIVHGSSASRPGMIFTGILGRRLDVPVLNLGFSGSAICEPELAHFLAELDPAFFVVDPLPNMNEERVRANTEPFLRILREARPETPILMVEDRCHAHEWLHPEQRKQRLAKRAAFREIYERLEKDDADRLHYVEGDQLLGGDSDLTTDGSHPSDLGYRHMADALEPVWRRLLTLSTH